MDDSIWDEETVAVIGLSRITRRRYWAAVWVGVGGVVGLT